MIRSIFVRLHRYLGLTLALFLIIAGLTGALISWDRELDEWLNPELFKATHSGQPQDPLVLANRLEAQQPELRITFLSLTREPGRNWVGSVSAKGEAPLGYNQIALDPVSGEVKGQRQWGEVSLDRANVLPFLYKLHYSLHLPKIKGVELGTLLMGVLAIAWSLDSLIALWISFPNRNQWCKSFRFRLNQGSYKRNFDLHRSAGVWLFPLLLILAVTSVSMNLRNEVTRPLVRLFSNLTPTAFETNTPSATPKAPSLTREEILALAQAKAVGLNITRPPGGIFYAPNFGIYGVGFYEAGNGHGDGGLGNPWLYFNGADGSFLSAQIPGQGSAGDIFMQAQFPLHSGRILGFPGRIMVSLLGILVAVVSITGVTIWARKRRARVIADQQIKRVMQGNHDSSNPFAVSPLKDINKLEEV